MHHFRRYWSGLVLLTIWALFAAWQFVGYRHERSLIRDALQESSHAVMNALVGGIRSHRRLGRFVQEQLPGMLEALQSSNDVLAVAVAVPSRGFRFSAGAQSSPDAFETLPPGDSWEPDGLRLVTHFEAAFADESGMGGGGGMGLGRFPAGPVSEAEARTVMVGLIMARTRTDWLVQRAAWWHLAATGAAGLLGLAFAHAWRTTVRLLESQSRTELLEVQAAHSQELNQAAAGLAHETRHPLGLIRGWVQQLRDEAIPGELQSRASAVLEECDRLAARINQFLSFARPARCEPVPVRLRELVGELRAILETDLEPRRLTLVDNLDPRAEVVRADRELLRQAVFNLLQNAIAFAPPGSRIEINTVAGWADKNRQESRADRVALSCPLATESVRNKTQRSAWHFPHGFGGEGRGEGAESERTSRNELPPRIRRLETLSRRVFISPGAGTESSLTLEVVDRGPGVPESRIASLFVPYFTTRPGGTGLGLAIVRRIADAHGWHVGYRPHPQGGAVFFLRGISIDCVTKC